LYSNVKLHQWNIVVYEKLGLVVCKQCRQGVLATQLQKHIIGHDYSGASIEEIKKAIALCPLTLLNGSKEKVVIETFKDPWESHEPIPFLQVYDGFQCVQCGYCCGKAGSMRGHYSSYHKNLITEHRYLKVKVQSLFFNKVSNFKYFRVTGKYNFVCC
jgi:hypothetical protein